MKKTTLLKSMLLLCALIVGSGSSWADTDVTIYFGSTSGYWAANSAENYTDSDSRSWSRTFSAGSKSSNGTNYAQFGNSSNACTSLVLTATAGKDMTVTAFSVTMAGASANTAGTIYLYKRTSGGSETQLATASVSGTGGVTCSISSSQAFSSTDILKVSYVGTAKAIQITELSYSYTTSAVAAPSFLPAAGAVEKGTSVTLSAVDGATIYYTMGNNPATPTTESAVYSSAIIINSATTIKAIAKKGSDVSEVSTASYTIKKVETPTFSVVDGSTVLSGTKVTISSETASATIHYTTDGSSPTSSSTTYSGAITIDANVTIKAIAVKNNWDDSDVATASYTIAVPVPGLSIDFEATALAQYTDWEFNNIGIHSNFTGVSAHSGTHWGSNVNPSTDAAVTTASITTANKIVSPGTLTFYASKESDNTTSSSWKVQYSSNGSTWTDIETFDAKSMSKGSWTKYSASLAGQTDVYVRLYYTGSNAKRAVDDITLTTGPSTPTDNGDGTITITTSANMDGWRAFYDASQDYSVDANTTIYVAKKSATEGVVELTAVVATKIPQGEAVILKTTDAGHSMTLTETTGAESLGANVLTVTDGTNNVDGYRMGYGKIGGSDAVGFFKYTTTTAPAAGIVYIDKDDVNVSAGAHGLAIDFGETTAIKTVNADKQLVAPRKVMKDGRIVIESAKGTFTLSGARMK